MSHIQTMKDTANRAKGARHARSHASWTAKQTISAAHARARAAFALQHSRSFSHCHTIALREFD